MLPAGDDLLAVVATRGIPVGRPIRLRFSDMLRCSVLAPLRAREGKHPRLPT